MRRKTRVLFATLLGMVLALGVLSGLTLTAYADPVYYDLWVGGVRVYSDNAGDVLGTADGDSKTVKFAPAKDGAPATLTLDGANITTGHTVKQDQEPEGYYGIYYAGEDSLTIVVASDSEVDVSKGGGEDNAGIYCEHSDLTITGEGKLTAMGGNKGISALYNVTIDKAKVDASGVYESGIQARQGSVVIKDSTVTAKGGIDGKAVEVNSSTVDASGGKWGIYGDSVTISGGEVTATASDDEGNGINANSQNEKPGTVTITGGTVSATGGASGHGIYAQQSGEEKPGTVTIDSNVTSVTISGGTQAVKGDVSYAVAGMGWTDAEGKTGKTIIATKDEGQDLSTYKKVQFPVPVPKVTVPTATNPTYDGKAQELVTGGSAEGGTMQYRLDGTTWSDKVPTGTEIKTYTVWYKAVGDESHDDTEPQSVESTIAKADPAYTQPGPLSAPAGSTLGSVALPKADNGVWSWQDPADTSVGEEVGETKTFLATFTPSDTTHYNTVENVKVDVNIIKSATGGTTPEPGKPTYTVMTGSGSAWAEGSSGALTFTFKRSEGDEETFRRFRSASVDGKLLTKDRDYRATAGSVVIELQPAYLATLAAGEHTLSVAFDDGGTADAKFTVTGAALEKDYPSPEVSNSRGGAITSRADAVTFTVTQGVPAEATSVRVWAELETVLALTHGREGVAVTVDGQPFQGADVTVEGQRVTVSVADATALRGKALAFSYTAKLRDGADLSAYLNADKSIASVPYRAFTTFDGDEDTVYGSAVEYVKFKVGAASGTSQAPQAKTPTTPAKANALPKTNDPAPLAAVATLAATGAAFAAAGLRRRKDQ